MRLFKTILCLCLECLLLSACGHAENYNKAATENSDTSPDAAINAETSDNTEKTLSEAYKDYFPVGAAINSTNLKGYENLIKTQFNSITAENEMKPEALQPYEDKFSFQKADKIVDFAVQNNLKVRGHTLIWHNQTPNWMFRDDKGGLATRDELLSRMENHIKTVVQHYKGKVYAWDVVNEAIADGSDFYRDSLYMDIIGEDFIRKAFIWAHEADPDALLFYNDYNTEDPIKREKIYKMLESLISEGVPVHGIGLQGHYDIFSPSLDEVQQSIDLFSSLGLIVQITELDMSLYQYSEKGLRFDEPPTDRLKMWGEKYTKLFGLFRKNKGKLAGVTFWGLADNDSWLNYFPVKDRPNWPLLFDGSKKPKDVFYEIVNYTEP